MRKCRCLPVYSGGPRRTVVCPRNSPPTEVATPALTLLRAAGPVCPGIRTIRRASQSPWLLSDIERTRRDSLWNATTAHPRTSRAFVEDMFWATTRTHLRLHRARYPPAKRPNNYRHRSRSTSRNGIWPGAQPKDVVRSECHGEDIRCGGLVGRCLGPACERSEGGAEVTSQIDGSARVRRTVSVVFADVTASTALAERLDSESFHDVLDQYCATCTSAVERHGGRVAKFIGDAVVGVFCLPTVHEDDALRAVRAEIGRAACRERGEVTERGGAV